MIVNGVKCETIEQLETEMESAGISEAQKDLFRNDFNGVPNIPAVETVPRLITPRQVRLAMISAGISLSTIDDFIQSLPEPTKSQAFVWWEYSLEFQRNNGLMNALAPQLGLSQTDLDNLFIAGASL